MDGHERAPWAIDEAAGAAAMGSNKRGRRPSRDDETRAHTEDEWEGGGMMEDRGRAMSAAAASGGGGSGGKADIVRRRNCENARKARARKKMEVSQLQEQAAQLKQAHIRAREESRTQKNNRARKETLRKDTLRKFLDYRCSNEKGYKEWADIVEETFTMTLPITPYRWFSGQDVLNNSRVLFGIEHLMTDNGSLAVLIESLGSGTLPWKKEMEKGVGHGVKLVCDIGDDDIIVTGDTVMCCFVLRTTNAVEHGAKCEWLCRGMMSAKFSPVTDKLAAAEHVFDVTSLMQQLQTAVGDKDEMPVVPNTPGGACQPSTEPRVITTATPPFTVVRCNESWTKLCGYPQESIQGRTLGVLQGPSTDASVLASLKSEIQRGQATSSLLVNYKHDGSSFLNYLRVYPLVGDALGNVTHFLGVLQEQAQDPADESKTCGVGNTLENDTQARLQNDDDHDHDAKMEDWKQSQLDTRHQQQEGTNISAESKSSYASTMSTLTGPKRDSTRGSLKTTREINRRGRLSEGGEDGTRLAAAAAAAMAATKAESGRVLPSGSDRREREAGRISPSKREVTRKGGEHADIRTSVTISPSSRPKHKRDKQSATAVHRQARLPVPPPSPPDEIGKGALSKNDDLTDRRACTSDDDSQSSRGSHQSHPRVKCLEIEQTRHVQDEDDGSRDETQDRRSSQDSPQGAGDETYSLETNDSLSGVGLSLGDSRDSPNPFLAWEDVLDGPGDLLEDLGALSVEESLNAAGTRVVKAIAEGEGGVDNVADANESADRPRARSDSLLAMSSSRHTLEQSFHFPDGDGGGISDGGQRSAFGRHLAPGWDGSGNMEGIFLGVERTGRAVSDRTAWQALPPRLRGSTLSMGGGGTGGGFIQQAASRSGLGRQMSVFGGVQTAHDMGSADLATRLQMQNMAGVVGSSRVVGLGGHQVALSDVGSLGSIRPSGTAAGAAAAAAGEDTAPSAAPRAYVGRGEVFSGPTGSVGTAGLGSRSTANVDAPAGLNLMSADGVTGLPYGGFMPFGASGSGSDVVQSRWTVVDAPNVGGVEAAGNGGDGAGGGGGSMANEGSAPVFWNGGQMFGTAWPPSLMEGQLYQSAGVGLGGLGGGAEHLGLQPQAQQQGLSGHSPSAGASLGARIVLSSASASTPFGARLQSSSGPGREGDGECAS